MKGIPPEYLVRKPRHPFNCSPAELKKVHVRPLKHEYGEHCEVHQFQCIDCQKRWKIYKNEGRQRLPHGYWQCRGKGCNLQLQGASI